MAGARGLGPAAVALFVLSAPPFSSGQESRIAPRETPAVPEWSFSGSSFVYFARHERNFGGGVLSADRGRLHLEGRFNYEDLNTGSLFAGWKFTFGGKVEIEATPMAGVVFGETDAVAPAYVARVAWGALELYTEGEYLFDLHEASDNFFTSWSEVSLRLPKWFRVGLAAERTRIVEGDVGFHWGPLAGLTYGDLELTFYVFTEGVEDPITVISLEVGF